MDNPNSKMITFLLKLKQNLLEESVFTSTAGVVKLTHFKSISVLK